MPPGSPSIFQEQVAAHEERIQRLESEFSEVSAQLAAQSIQLDYLSDAIRVGLATINQKLDVLSPLSGNVEFMDKTLEEHTSRLAELEGHEKGRVSRREERLTNYTKLFWGLLIALGGALGKDVGTFFWHIFHR